jgi:HEAT repeat protein
MSEIPFLNLLDDLLDEQTIISSQLLYRLSDLDTSEITLLSEAWPKIPVSRRQALLTDLEELGATDTLLSFEAVGRHAIQDEDPTVRQLSIRILDMYEPEDLIPRFIEFLKTDPNAEVRAEAAQALGSFVYLGELDEIPDETCQDIQEALLLSISQDGEKIVQRRSLEAFSFTSRPETSDLLAKAFDSGDIEWMVSALFGMGRSADRRWSETILEMLEHKMPKLRLEASRAAGELELKEAVPILMDLLDDVDPDVRAATIWSLSQIGGQSVRQILEVMYEQAEDSNEIELLESALDNLSFTEDLENFSLFDFPGKDFETSLLEFDDLEDDEEFLDDTYYNDEDEEFED